MTLNPRLICSSDLEAYFVDKDTGEPLSGGIVTFYSDTNQNTLKPVYQLTGNNVTNYAYAVLDDPITLSSVGTMQDALGNNIVVYYYPWTGTPFDGTNSDVQELYYVTVTDSNMVVQFDRHRWPPEATEGGGGGGSGANNQDLVNFIPNGQFLSNINTAAAQFGTTINLGTYSIVSKNIAYGGWTQDDQTASGGIYTTKFVPLTNGSSSLNDFPYYLLEYKCTSAGTGVHQIGVIWPNVNQFEANNDHASLGTTPYTLTFYGLSNDSNNYNFDVHVIKYYGAGGSILTDTIIGSVTFNSNAGAYTTINIPGFGSDSTKTIGAGNYIEIALRAHNAGTTFDIQVSDFSLVLGTYLPENMTSFPEQTPAQSLSESIFGWVNPPAQDGSDLYLPVILTPSGVTFDHTGIGEIVTTMNATLTSSNCQWLLCDGTSYVSSQYSSIGIPYSRLSNVLIASNPVANIPLWGTGATFANAYVFNASAANGVLRLTYNTSNSSAIVATDGNTGWGFKNSAYASGSLSLIAHTMVTAATIEVFGATAITYNAHTSGFTFTTISYYTGYNAQDDYVVTILCGAASTLTNPGSAAKYFSITISATTYNVWYFFTNETSPGGTNIKIDLSFTGGSSLSAQDIANYTTEILNGYTVNTIAATGLPTASQYFNFSTNPPTNTAYYVWYTVAGVGVDPAVLGATGINVVLTGSETTAQMIAATQLSINKYQFATPSLQGVFLRGADPNALYDTDNAYRFSNVTGLAGAVPGTTELQQIIGHVHAPLAGNVFVVQSTGGAIATTGAGLGTTNTTAITGGGETRPINVSVNYFIRY